MASKHELSFPSMSKSGYIINYAEMIGHGSFGVVYKATNKYGVVVAAKVILKQARSEAIKSMQLPNKHSNIIDVYDVCEDDNNIYIFMEFCEFGNLRSFFAKRELNKEQKLQIMKQIAEGINHLHENDIIHRDLKPENILLQRKSDGSPEVKLGDFGLSKFIEPNEQSTMSSDAGTTWYKAPEFWDRDKDGKLQYKRAVDVFAQGLTFLAMLQTDMPKKLSVNVEVGRFDLDELALPIGQNMYTRRKNGIEIPSIVRDDKDDSIRLLIKEMVEVNHVDRPSAGDVVKKLSSICETGTYAN